MGRTALVLIVAFVGTISGRADEIVLRGGERLSGWWEIRDGRLVVSADAKGRMIAVEDVEFLRPSSSALRPVDERMTVCIRLTNDDQWTVRLVEISADFVDIETPERIRVRIPRGAIQSIRPARDVVTLLRETTVKTVRFPVPVSATNLIGRFAVRGEVMPQGAEFSVHFRSSDRTSVVVVPIPKIGDAWSVRTDRLTPVVDKVTRTAREQVVELIAERNWCRLNIDGRSVWSAAIAKMDLHEIIWTGADPKNISGVVDRWTVETRRIGDFRPSAEDRRDMIRRADGVESYGRIEESQDGAILFATNGGRTAVSWSEVTEVGMRSRSIPPRRISGEWVRIETAVPGGDNDRIRGALVDVTADRLVLEHELIGRLSVPRPLLREIRRLGFGTRTMVESGPVVLGDSGGKWTVPKQTGSGARAVTVELQVKRYRGEATGWKWELNGERVGPLIEDGASDPDGQFVRVRTVIPAKYWAAEENRLELIPPIGRADPVTVRSVVVESLNR